MRSADNSKCVACIGPQGHVNVSYGIYQVKHIDLNAFIVEAQVGGGYFGEGWAVHELPFDDEWSFEDAHEERPAIMLRDGHTNFRSRMEVTITFCHPRILWSIAENRTVVQSLRRGILNQDYKLLTSIAGRALAR